jgi:hypothetical protein|tara:strand:+ start:526 stop:732 length:207 start_codon:yes stop_codon:yes gene_type:complete
VNSVADEDIRQEDRQMHLTYERNLLEADQENEQIRAEMSTLESQVLVLQGALAVRRIVNPLNATSLRI